MVFSILFFLVSAATPQEEQDVPKWSELRFASVGKDGGLKKIEFIVRRDLSDSWEKSFGSLHDTEVRIDITDTATLIYASSMISQVVKIAVDEDGGGRGTGWGKVGKLKLISDARTVEVGISNIGFVLGDGKILATFNV